MKSIRCIRDKVLVKIEADPTHGISPGEGGPIEMPEAYTYHSCRGSVVAVGPGVQRYSKTSRRHYWVRPEVKQGDRVLVPSDWGIQLYPEGESGGEYRMGYEPELHLIIEQG